VANKNLAKVDAATGAALPFSYHPNGRVAHMEVVQGHLLVGGYFPGFLDSRNPVTGADDAYGTPAISGTYQYPGVTANPTRVYNMTPKADGTAVLMTGVFTSVGGQHHEQVFRLNMTAGSATVSAWSPSDLYAHCATVEPFYAQDATWSPDGTSVYVATTGFKLFDQPNTGPRTGPCDAAIAYPAEPQTEFAGNRWINYTGCDSLFSVAADATTVFIGGHQRWISNPTTCDRLGVGGVAQPGLGELNPADGTYQPGPSKGRGLGADDLLRTSAGLWIASDNQANTDSCAGVSRRMGICFLPN
jgi:hypothetical protein